ncbi:MAG: hypothetical protein ACLQVI_32245, partial [Polyangiaceae bacterium]
MSSRPSSLESLRSFRLSLLGGPLAAVLLAATPAAAQDAPSNCPPGSWFCADAQEKPAPAPPAARPAPRPLAPAAAQDGALEPLPPAEALPPPPPPAPPPPPVIYRRTPPPPPVVIYQQQPTRPPPPYYYYYRPTKP